MPRFRLFYHFVWSTKNREPMITDANQETIHAVIRHKIDEFGGAVHAINSMEDHIHVLATLPPKQPLSFVIGQIKGASSHAVPDLKWHGEYGVVSVSESHVPQIKSYIRRQREHHATQSLDRRLELG